jgi:nucleoside-diphosphate-sugar epimerase
MQTQASAEVPLVSRRIGVLLVTGAPGWLADRLLESLVKDPPGTVQHVRCLVHRSLAVDTASWARSLGLEVEVVRGDLTDPASLRDAVRGVSSIVHGAGIIHVDRIRDYYDVNTEGTHLLTEAAASAGAERMVFLSTNAAGGKSPSPVHPLREDEAPRPLSHYGRSKLLGERAMFAVANPIERVALRPCMFYGPPVPPRHVEIFKRIMQGRMPLVGGGNFARSLTHIDHLVQAVRLSLTHAGAPGNTFYVADAQSYTTREVVEAMARALDTSPRWLHLPSAASTLAYQLDTGLARLGRYWQTVHLVGEANWHVGVSIENARRRIGYAPPYTIDDGMRSAVAWCRERGLI